MQLIKGVNTYMTVEEADQLVSDCFMSDSEELKVWQGLSENDKSIMIFKGTKIAEGLPFLGRQYPGYQQMRWPRYINLLYYDCPEDIKIGIIMQVLKEKIKHSTNEYQLRELGVKTYSIKNASISFADSSSIGNGAGATLSNGIYKDIYDEYFSKWVY